MIGKTKTRFIRYESCKDTYCLKEDEEKVYRFPSGIVFGDTAAKQPKIRDPVVVMDVRRANVYQKKYVARSIWRHAIRFRLECRTRE